MAAAEHVLLAGQGSLAIARWRERYPSQRLDLRGADLQGLDLFGARLQGADLRGADLRGASLEEADLGRTDLRGANLEEAILTRAELCRADLRDAELCLADLKQANLTKADLGNASLPCAVLREAVLLNADLAEANLEEADLRGADLTCATLRGTNLRGARLDEALMWNTVLASVNLSRTRGLANVRHFGPSEIGVTTLSRSGAIPRPFLRGAGVPDGVVDGLTGLLHEAVTYRSCFLSYAEPDDEFVRQLHDDLVREGVLVWRWREDVRVGDRLFESIDRAIREHDRVIVVLSERSLASPAVQRELERAFFEEDERIRRGADPGVLLPVRLDDAVFDRAFARQRDLVARNVADFRHWREPTAYRGALQELLEALRVTADAGLTPSGSAQS